MARSTAEETLNALLDAEADQLCQAHKFERTAKRANSRAGHYKRKLHTTSREVQLKVPKLRETKFATAIIERHRPRDSNSPRWSTTN